MSIHLPVLGTDQVYEVRPTKIIAVGLNYLDHVKESPTFANSGLELPTEPVLFAKTPNVLIGPGEPIRIPAWLKEQFEDPRTDPEAELAVIIGKRARNLNPEEALDLVFGYTCFNDVSQRQIQKQDPSGWFRGKSFDTFGPIGPAVATPAYLDSLGLDPQALEISARINGVRRQYSHTSQMIFGIDRIISYISRQFTLEPGDIILTGTPSGVSPLSPGDIVEVEIQGIGILENRVLIDEA